MIKDAMIEAESLAKGMRDLLTALVKSPSEPTRESLQCISEVADVLATRAAAATASERRSDLRKVG